MLDLWLLALAWMIDPAAGERLARTGPPVAPWIQPTATVVQPKPPCAMTTHLAVDQCQGNPRPITALLNRWEDATRNIPDRSRTNREEFRRRIHNEFNEHTVAAAEEMLGRVTAKCLNDAYEWQIVQQDQGKICLGATPRDETERLFYGSLRIWLTADRGIPERLDVICRNHPPRNVWQSDRESIEGNIQLVDFEVDIPPSPDGSLRTASARTD